MAKAVAKKSATKAPQAVPKKKPEVVDVDLDLDTPEIQTPKKDPFGKLSDVFNTGLAKKTLRQIDVDYTRVFNGLKKIEIEGKTDLLAKIKKAYFKARTAALANIDPEGVETDDDDLN